MVNVRSFTSLSSLWVCFSKRIFFILLGSSLRLYWRIYILGFLHWSDWTFLNLIVNGHLSFIGLIWLILRKVVLPQPVIVQATFTIGYLIFRTICCKHIKMTLVVKLTHILVNCISVLKSLLILGVVLLVVILGNPIYCGLNGGVLVSKILVKV